MITLRLPAAFIILIAAISAVSVSEADAAASDIFPTTESTEDFAAEITELIGGAWRRWQDKVVIDDVDVEGSSGLLMPGDMKRPVLTLEDMLGPFDRRGKSQSYIACVRAVGGAVENGMRAWQRGYTSTDIPFPQGAACTYTLPKCRNIPVALGSGVSLGDAAMSEQALYEYMIYRVPAGDEEARKLFRRAASAVAACFEEWKSGCFIVDITASGGIAPQPSPMGTGPGPVRSARGGGGRLSGPYINTVKMLELMTGETKRKQGDGSQAGYKLQGPVPKIGIRSLE
jgi:hypothetical protein